MDERTPILPAHVEDTVRSIARLHADHRRSSTGLQRAVSRTVGLAGQPTSIAVLSVLVLGWVAGNLLGMALGYHAVDPPPFAWLGTAVSLVALYTTLLILITQRHDDQLAQHREQLTLELAIIGEQKSAKIIELIEEMRRDNPLIANRVDLAAAAMATPTDPHSVLDAFHRTHEAMNEEEETDEAEPDEAKLDEAEDVAHG